MDSNNLIHSEFIDKTIKGDIPGLTNILSQTKLDVNFVDEHGMTPLHHAAFKGNKDVVELLIHHGADVNSSQHEHNYSALHFASLSGSVDVCHILLEAGAKPDAVNSVGRTATQMAAFVGNHSCAISIKNFIPKSIVDYYTEVNGLETEPKLPPYLASPVHHFITCVNLNPVRIALNLQKCQAMMDNLTKIKMVLELLTVKNVIRGDVRSERLSLKFHYVGYVVAEVIRCKEVQNMKKNLQQDNQTNDEKKLSNPVELFIKKLLKVNKNDVSEYQESFIRECIREFPGKEFLVFREVVTNLANVNSMNGNALDIIIAAIQGERAFNVDAVTCYTCGEEKPSKKCSKCKTVQYCDRECQRLHWFVHKKACTRSTTTTTTSVESELENIKIN